MQRFVLLCTGFIMTVTPAMADCKADIQRLLDRADDAGPYRMETTTEVMGETIRSQIEVVPPDARRLTSTIDGVYSEIVIIADRGWRKEGEGWAPLPPAQSTQPESASLASGTNFVCSIATVVDGREALMNSYEYRGQETVTRYTIIVDALTGLPIESNGVTQASGTQNTSTTRYVYDSSISIQAPSGQ